jgi:hypothetical protein
MRPTGDHFYTTSAQELAGAIAGVGYVSEGVACWVFPLPTPPIPPPGGTTPLYRLFNWGNGDHFYTTSVAERDGAIQNAGYADEGVACYVYANPASNTTPLFRLFNPANGDHFYTTSGLERDNAVQNGGYINEGIACHVFNVQQGPPTVALFRLLKRFGARVRLHLKTVQDHIDEGVACHVFANPTPATTPLYRVYSAGVDDHFYTTSAAERDGAIQNLGYVDEGVACHVFANPAPDTTPLYRLYSARVNDHFYTTSAAERDGAIQNVGYVDEGVACHVFANPAPNTTPLFRTWRPPTGDHFYTTSADERNTAVLNPLALLNPPAGVIPVNNMVQSMQQTYEQVNILVEVGSTQNLSLPNLVDVPPGSPQQTALFTNRDNVGGTDIVVYFVRTAGGNNGFAPLGSPSAVVASIASPWTQAHEVGHSLNVPHIPGEDCAAPGYQPIRLMTGCGTNRIINPPPDLIADEVATMDGRSETVDI